MKAPYDRDGRAGFTILEALIVMIIFGIALAGLAAALRASYDSCWTGSAESRVADQLRKATSSIISDLRASGRVEITPGLECPYLFENGDADPYFEHHSHDPAVNHADPESPAYGPSREIIFMLPRDTDGNGLPTLEGIGTIDWGPEEYSFVLVTNAQGANELQKRVNGMPGRVIARNVERLVFDDWTTDPTLTMGEVGVTVYMQKRSRPGRLVEASLHATVEMRNLEER